MSGLGADQAIGTACFEGRIAAVLEARREISCCVAWARIWNLRNRLHEEGNIDVHHADPGNQPPSGMSTLQAVSGGAQAPEMQDRANLWHVANPHGECALRPAIALRRRGPALEREG